VTLALGFLLIPAFGMLGAAWTLLAATALVWGVAHLYARGRIGPLPFAGPLVRPALASVAAAALFTWIPSSSAWLPALSALVLFLLTAALLEPRLLRDVRAAMQRPARENAAAAKVD
jgi:O-antigen/teichoic acid export membrane protein